MGEKAKINGFQFFLILFLSRMFSLLSYSSLEKSHVASKAVLVAVLISFFVDLLMLAPIFLLQRKNHGVNFIDSVYNLTKIGGKIAAAVFFLLAVCVAAQTVSKFEFFLTSSAYVEASHILISILFVLVALYAVYMGIEALARFSLFVFVVFVAAALFILIANTGKFELANIEPFVFSEQWDGIFSTVINLSLKNTEYFLIMLAATEVRGKVRNSILSWLAAITIIFFAVCTMLYGVMGEASTSQLFPFFTLASTAELSIFQRLDALHIGIWIFIAFIKTAIYIFYGGRALRYLLPERGFKFSVPVAGGCVLLLSAFLSSNLRYLEVFAGWAFHPYVYLGIAFVLPLLVLIFTKVKQKGANVR